MKITKSIKNYINFEKLELKEVVTQEKTSFFNERKDIYYCYNNKIFEGKSLDKDKTYYYIYLGKLHNENGPAIVRLNNNNEWYYYGKKIECSSQNEFELHIMYNILEWNDLCKFTKHGRIFSYKEKLYSGIITLYKSSDEFHRIEHIKNGKYHRLDGPAIEFPNKIKINEWYYNGKKIYCKNKEEFNKLTKLLLFW